MSLISPSQVPSLQTASLIGEAASRTVTETWSPYVSLRIGYGATEMNSYCLPFHDEPTGTLPPYYLLPNSDYSLYILRPGTIELCLLYTPGEICLSLTWMSSGYINRPDETSKVFAPHPFPGDAGHAYIYRTSDIGMLVGEQGFVVLGRVDFQFKIDGNRVQPEEVESIINHVPHVVRSSVILVAPSIGRPVTTCCVVLKDILTTDIDANSFWTDFISTAEKACSDHLPAYMKPYRWLRFDEFPETPIGKTDTATLTRAAKFIIDNGSSVMTNGYQQKNPKLILVSDTQYGSESFEAVFLSSMLQQEIFVISMLEPKSWMFYQFFDLSQFDCTGAQLLEGICLLVSMKQNLRTVFLLLDVANNPITIETPDSAFDLIKNTEFVQAVLKLSEFRIEFSQDAEIVDPDVYRIKDSTKPWLFLRPLWRVAFLLKSRLLAWTFHHSIVDAWVAHNIAEDLHAILTSIIQRDSCEGE
ncbi:hypothetical protein CSUB01_12193 [Colletotrichum sublineola]|uniref:Uncharacterized protein n=1 Tax=Colletotrichum sublineola TaxID=1173701 RepID=A0A066XCN7_COLSU|nr:hypothetical protein CSUB01_12193 [Colletotrichum sublineola]